MTVRQPVDQGEVSRSTTARAYGQMPGHLSIRPSRKGRHFFMSHVQPLDVLILSNDICQAIQRIADDAVHASHTSRNQGLDEDVTNASRHGCLRPMSWAA